MRKITPIIMTMIMLMSAFASIGWSELDEMKTSNDADARAGPDGEVTDITEPKATAPGTLPGDPDQHTIDAGSEVIFEIFIKNVGDADITQMGITVTIYEDPDGQPGGPLGPVVTDSSGAPLIWQNNDLICDDAFACPQTTLAPGAVLDGGAYLVSVQGSIVTWMPDVGDYQIMVQLDSEGAGGAADAEPDNDMKLQFVSVVDWTDVIVDLRWFSGKDVEGGSGAKDFTLSVSTDGSIAWEARNIVLELEVKGALVSAVTWSDLDGDNQTHGGDHHGGESAQEQQNTLDIGTKHILDEIGTFGNVITWENGQDRDDNTTDDRWNMRLGAVWTLNGTVTPDGAASNGVYEINVLLKNYTIFGQFSPECDNEVNQTGGGEDGTLNSTVFVTDYCETAMLKDDNSANSEDIIEGEISNYHDMSITSLTINQRYAKQTLGADGFPNSTSSDPGLLGGPLQPGLATVQAKVNHNGNDPGALNDGQKYSWNVTFEITSRSTGVTTTSVATECYNGEVPGGMAYADLGGTGPSEADACAAFDFTPGTYDVLATVSFLLKGVVPDEDRNSFNDEMRMNSLSVLNNRPTVTLSIGTDSEIVAGEATEVMFEADASDVEDPSGDSLVYNWTYPGMVQSEGGLANPFDGVGKAFDTVVLQISGDDWIGYKSVTVTVSDVYSSASDTVSFKVWNHVVSESTSTSGVKMTYDLTYADSNPFSITLTDSADGYTAQSLDGYTGTYDSVAVLDYDSSTLYDGTNVLTQSITVDFNTTTLDPTSAWYVDTNGLWFPLATSAADFQVEGTVGTITFDILDGAGTIADGKIVLMGGELQEPELPAAHPMGFSMSATTGGNIGMAWSYQGTYTENDWVEIQICPDASGCATPDVIKPGITMTAHSLSGQGGTTHGTTYFATILVCNEAGCNAVVGSANATADSQVDGNPTATAVTVANGEGVWVVSWTATGDTSDVKNWKVCYDDSPWTVAGDMPGDCVSAADGATSADVTMSTLPGTKKFYFTAVPVDSMGNYDTAVSSADIDYIGVDENPGQNTGSDVGSTTDVDGDVPPWTWGVIIGIVVVAFVVGAFILSRGGEGDEGKDWDY